MIPAEGTPLELGLVKFEFKERDFGENTLPSLRLNMELRDTEQPSGAFKMVYLKQQDIS